MLIASKKKSRKINHFSLIVLTYNKWLSDQQENLPSWLLYIWFANDLKNIKHIHFNIFICVFCINMQHIPDISEHVSLTCKAFVALIISYSSTINFCSYSINHPLTLIKKFSLHFSRFIVFNNHLKDKFSKFVFLTHLSMTLH